MDPTSSNSKRDYNEVKDFTRKKENAAMVTWTDLVTGMLVIIAILVTCGACLHLSDVI
jgi:hypothetical protein